MHKVALAILLVFALSGCTSSGSGLNAYLMQPGELPSGCQLADITQGQAKESAEFLDMKSNPGAVNTSAFHSNGIEPVAAVVAFYSCGAAGQPDFVSAAERFATPDDASAWAASRIQCDDSPTFQNGAILGAIEPWDGGWDPEHLPSAKAAAQRIMGQTGAVDLCP